ncbi:DUF6923 family protein [Streptomyces sp. NPDC052042]|uniref:DUF7507 domain-containing protein n=1 Tax=Streptomyces sp. NPDC052042 TaxID=3365683 RepID=UPI0037D24891
MTALAAPLFTAPASYAAAGDPFDPADPTVFVAQDMPTRLYKAITGASGSVTFQPEGGAVAGLTYNAIGYNPADNYLYGVVGGASTAMPIGSIIRIGQGGVVTRVGNEAKVGSLNWGAFAPDGGLYVGSTATDVAYRVDAATGKVTSTIQLPMVPTASDLTYADGYFWGLDPSGKVVRVDLLGATKTVTTFGAVVPATASGFGAAWTFGNGNIGISDNVSGTVYQIKITNPGSANPTFTLVSSSPGPASGNNDGAASPGLPTDLALVKKGPETFKPGTPVTYTLTVKNNGPGNSSGYTVTDVVPAPLTNVKSSTPGCTVAGNTVTCVGGRTLAGAENTITITADSPAGMTKPVTNTAKVVANEKDPTPDNNESSTEGAPLVPGLSVRKTADPQTVKAAGEKITYSFVLTNTGNVELKDLAVKETSFSGTGTAPVADCPDGPLAPGKSVTCTATYTVTQKDIDAGSLENTATGTGTPPDGGEPVVSPPSEAKVSAPPEAALTVVKSGQSEKPDKLVAGEKVEYAFVVTNTGNVTLKDVKVKEGDFTGSGTLSDVVCPAGAASLAPGANVTCSASYEVTQADVDAGSIKNSATATGTPPGETEPPVSPPSEVEVPAPGKPDLKVVKSATTEKPGELVAGEKVEYEFAVTNTGNVTLKDVKVNEGEFTGTGKLSDVVCPAGAASLAPGASVTCSASYEVTQADVDAGSIKNSATSTGTPPGGTEPPVSPPSEVEVPAPGKPDLKVVKTATTDKPGELVVGEKVSYEFLVTNTGNVTLKDVKVKEGEFTGTGKLSDVACPAEAASLAPGKSVTCSASYEVTQADVDAGSIKNSATSTGTPPGGTEPPVSPPSEVEVPAPGKPDLKVVKTATTDKPGELVAGEKVSYEFLVTNTGNVTLKDVKVKEGEFTGTGKLSDVACPAEAASLAPGKSVTCSASYEVTQADVDAGSIKNSATSTGTPPGGTEPPVSPPSEVEVPAPGKPDLKVVKTATTDKPGELVAGEKVEYEFAVTNTGNVTLKDVKVKEGEFTGTGKLSDVVCPAGAASLAPGASVTCSASYEVTQADVDAGSIKNSATSTGTPPGGTEPPVSPPSEVEVPAPGKPDLKVVKTATTDKPGELVVGEKVSYEFLVTNTGNVTLKDVKVKEGEFTGTGKLSDVACPAEAASLAPGKSVTCSASYEVTQADVDAGSIKNSATSTGTPPGGTEPPVSPPSEVEVPAPGKPDLKVVKTATTDKPGELVVGEKVEYAFLVTNTGNVTLKDVKVKEGDFTGSGKLSDVVCPAGAGSLAPGKSVTCSASYEVTQADVDAGSIENSATATGTPPGEGEPPVSPPSKVKVPTPQEPALTVVKSASTEKPGELVAGEKIDYAFVVTNTGNVTLKDVKVDEGEFTGSGKLSDVVCPAGAGSLAPGKSVTCSASYEVTQADVDAGSIKNSATATGTPPGETEPPVSPPSEVEVPAPPKPALTVVKTGKAEKPGQLVAGEKVDYAFLVTNTGNVTLKDITVKEGEFTGSGKLSEVVCPEGAESLVPGASVTCKASYEVTQADVDAGSIENSATATGTPPGGTEPPVSPPSKVTVPPTGEGLLDLVKTAKPVDVNKNGRTDLGDRIEWTLKVSNKGTRTVTDIRVSDPTAGQVTCPATSLAPGASMDCTAPAHTITAKDVTNGKVVNKATASGKSGDKEIFSPEASSTVKVKPDDKPTGPGAPNGPGTPNGPNTPYVPGAGPNPPVHKSSGPLASTGAKALTLLGIGGALLAAGGLALGLSRRRSRTN